jgi:hypothetical protein
VSDHTGDGLSGLLDGALTTAEADAVRSHVAHCDDCARELEDVRRVRRLVRELPAVEPPDGFFAGLLRQDDVVPITARRRRGVVAVMSGSVAAGLLLLVLAAGGVPPAEVRPEVVASVERHASTVGALEAAGLISHSGDRFVSAASVPPTTAEPRATGDLPAPFDAPERLAGYELVEAYAMDGGLHLLYRRGSFALSIFQMSGDLDWDALPDDGTRVHIAGKPAWRWDERTADGRLWVIDDDGMVVVLIGDEPGDAVLAVASELPGARSMPMRSRMQRTVAKALELFSPAP